MYQQQQRNPMADWNRIVSTAQRGNPQAQRILSAVQAAMHGNGQMQGWAPQQFWGPQAGNAHLGYSVAGTTPGWALGGWGMPSHPGHGGLAGFAYRGQVAGPYGIGDATGMAQLPIPAGGLSQGGAASLVQGGFGSAPDAGTLGWVDPNVVMGAPLGFDSGGTTLVQPAQAFQLTSRPQEIFRGERFLIGSDIAPSLVVSDLKVGNRSQLINATNVPGMAFANTTIGASLRFETAQPGQDIVWTGINISGGQLRVLGCLVGSAAVRK